MGSRGVRTGALVCGILALAFAVRLAWTLWTQPIPLPFTDPEYYNATALSLANGDGYSVAFEAPGFRPGGAATALWPPGYSLILAGAYAVFGESLTVARLVNVVAGSLTVIPIYFIGRRLFGTAVALVGAGIAAVLPSLVFWTPVLLSETIFTLLFASAFAVLLHSDGPVDRRWRFVVLLGLTMGAAALVRGQAFVLLMLAPLWWVLMRSTVRDTAKGLVVLCLALAAMIAPWMIRNAIVMDSPIVLSANFGYNLRIGHAEYSTGYYSIPSDLWEEDPGISFHERELLFNDLGRARALNYATSHPARELELSGRKIMWLWRPDSDALNWTSSYGRTPFPDGAREPLRWLLDVTYLTTLGLAGAGMFIQRRSSAIPFVAALLVLWTGVHIVFFGEPRYHLPLLAAIVPLAASAIVSLAERVAMLREA